MTKQELEKINEFMIKNNVTFYDLMQLVAYQVMYMEQDVRQDFEFVDGKTRKISNVILKASIK